MSKSRGNSTMKIAYRYRGNSRVSGCAHGINFRRRERAALRCAALLHGGAMHATSPEGGTVAEEVTITGTRIRGIAPVGAPTLQVGREQMEVSTASSVADILKEVPQIFSQGIDESSFTSTGVSASNVARSSAINLRGLSPV